MLASAAAAPFAVRSEFVARKRAELHLDRARKHLALQQPGEARAELRQSLRLRPGDAEARRELVALELAQGSREIAFLELQTLTELHPEDPGAWIALADLMSESGWLEAPEAALDRAIDADPRRADAHARRGGIRLRLGRYAGARADAEAAVAAAPKDAAAWALLARSAARSQGTAAGLDAANRGIASAGRDPALLRVLARLSIDGGRAEEAVALLEEAKAGGAELARERLKAGDGKGAQKLAGELTAAELGPAPAPPRRLRADAQTDLGRLGAWTREHWTGRLLQVRESLQVELEKKDWAAAARIVEAAQREYPETSFAAYLAGTLELSRGNADEAEKRFSEALAIAPRLPIAVAALARTWASRRGAAYAADRLMRLAERDPGLASARYMAARAYVEARDPIKAEAALRRGLLLQPDSPVPYQHLADYYFGLDRTAEALEICQQGLSRFPLTADLPLMLAQISAALGRTDEAARAYSDLVSRRPDLDLARYKLAMLLASRAQGEEDRARLLQIAAALRNDAPSDPLLLDALGWVQLRAGDARRARELLQAAVRGAPEEPAPHFHLASLYARERQEDLARGELKLALESPRPFPERLDAMRLLRESDPAPTGSAAVAPGRH